MDFEELIGKHRDLYINGLLDFYKQRNNGVKELLLSFNNEEPILEFRLYRMDYYEQINGESKMAEFVFDKYFDFMPTEYKYDTLNIRLNPFYWHGCEFILTPAPATNDWLIAWITKWIDEGEQKDIDSTGLQGVIHNVSKPKTMNTYSFSVDFGSVGTDAFMDIIKEIYTAGATDLQIGSFSMIDKSKGEN